MYIGSDSHWMHEREGVCIAVALPARSVRGATQAAVASLPAATLGATLANLELATGRAFISAGSDALVDALVKHWMVALPPNRRPKSLGTPETLVSGILIAQISRIFERIDLENQPFSYQKGEKFTFGSKLNYFS